MTARRTQSSDVEPARARPTRLVPPQLGEVERRSRRDRDAERFTRGLRGDRRRRLLLLGGNLLILALLVGLPLLRGRLRADAALRAYTTFASCLVGAKVTGGLGDPAGEAELLAARLARPERAWLARCRSQLERLAPEPVLFVLPSVKAAEARVHEAVAMLRGELLAFAAHVPGTRMPDRPLRALRLLRGTLKKQLDAAGAAEREAELPSRIAGRGGLATPARLPLFTAADASLSVWGDDFTLRVVALDGNGVSYLELEPGKPFTRARATRPRSLRAFLKSDERDLLVWGTAPARCAERAAGCFGKTTQLAVVRAPLLQLPESRALAFHLAGRPDRSLAWTDAGLVVATLSAERRALVQRVALAPDFSVGNELPALGSLQAGTASSAEALVLSSAGEAVVLGLERDAAGVRLLQLAPTPQPLATLPSAEGSWLSGCADDTRAGFALGSGGQLSLGTLQRVGSGFQLRSWPALPLSVPRAIDPEASSRDRARSLCVSQAALLVARDAGDRLVAVVCSASRPACTLLPVASGVEHFSLLATPRGALIAYAGREAAQVRVRALDLERIALDDERIPAACWTRGGLCARPTLARLGQRIVLLAPDKTDLLAIESADEGQTWSTLPVL